MISDNRDTALERIMAELDVLFCPETLEYFSLVFFRAKINVVYYNNGRGMDSLKYRALGPLSIPTGHKHYFIRKIEQVEI